MHIRSTPFSFHWWLRGGLRWCIFPIVLSKAAFNRPTTRSMTPAWLEALGVKKFQTNPRDHFLNLLYIFFQSSDKLSNFFHCLLEIKCIVRCARYKPQVKCTMISKGLYEILLAHCFHEFKMTSSCTQAGENYNICSFVKHYGSCVINSNMSPGLGHGLPSGCWQFGHLLIQPNWPSASAAEDHPFLGGPSSGNIHSLFRGSL